MSRREALNARLRTAPRTSKLASLRRVAAADRRRADSQAANARALRATARQLRSAWHGKNTAHQTACASAQLPTTPDELTSVRTAAETAAIACEQLARRLADLTGRVQRRLAAVAQVRGATAVRVTAEATADQDWLASQSADAEFAAVRENVGRDAERVRAELRVAEEHSEATVIALRKAREDEADLGAEGSRRRAGREAFPRQGR